MEQVKATIDRLEADLQRRKWSWLETAHEKTNQPRAYIVLGIGSLVTLLLLLLTSLEFVSHILGMLPLMQSYRGLSTRDHDDNAFWLTYWVMNAMFATVEAFLSDEISWMPLFYLIKIGVLIWAHHPATRGAFVVYKKAIEPFLTRVGSKSIRVDPGVEAAPADGDDRPPSGGGGEHDHTQ